MAINSDSDKLRVFLHAKIAKRKKQIHREHGARFNYDMQLQIDCIDPVLISQAVFEYGDQYSMVIRSVSPSPLLTALLEITFC